MSTKNVWGKLKRYSPLAMAALLVLLLSLTTSRASAQAGIDGPLLERLTVTGQYGTVVGGAGLVATGINSLTMTVPGTRIEAAYLYWAGTGVDEVGDNEITFQVNANAPQSLTADHIYGPSFWYLNPFYHHVFVRDITSLAQLGTHTYTMSDYTVSGPIDSALAYGFGIVVVYEDPTLNTRTIVLKDGLDSVWFGFDEPRDSPSSVNCMTFEANLTSPRVMDFYVFVGGSADSIAEDRPNRLHYIVGSGTVPTQVVGAPGSVAIQDPFTSADGRSWDTYRQMGVVIPAGSTYVCLQTESVEGFEPTGASFLWLMGGFTLKNETPTAVSLATITANNPMALPAVAVTLALVLFSGITGLLVTRRQRL
ncbi:MAG: hypothetical protein IPM39_12995 [Chloroflexi bacterium]|nr:hypothetical protein [Chloroflexota bacterium]